MTILLVDSDRSALNRAVNSLTKLNAAVTVVMQSSPEAAVSYTMCNPVDIIFSHAGLFTPAQIERIQGFQAGIQWFPFWDGQDISSYLFPYINM